MSPPQQGPGLRPNALTFVDSIVMAVAGTAPAFSIAATTGVLIAAVGVASPAALVDCAIPMVGIAWAFAYLNRRDPSAGASYSWVGRAMHPALGFIAGWCCLVAVTLFMVSGSVPVASLTLSLFSSSAADDLALVTALGCGLLLVVLGLILFGVHISARAQRIMAGIEVGCLAVFGVLAIVHISHHAHRAFRWGWFGLGHFHGVAGFAVGALVAAYYYWGWDVTANLSEETADSRRSAGAGGLIGIAILIAMFVFYTVVIQMIVPGKAIAANSADVLAVLARDVWPSAGGKVMVVAVVLSSLATLETALIQSTRTVMVMAQDRTMPAALGRVHSGWRTPWVAAIVLTGIAIALYVASNLIGSVSTLLGDAISAIGLDISVYYGLAGIAVAIVYRRELLRSPVTFLFAGLWPFAGGLFMLWTFAESIRSLDAVSNAIGLGGIALGAVVFTVVRIRRGLEPPAPGADGASISPLP